MHGENLRGITKTEQLLDVSRLNRCRSIGKDQVQINRIDAALNTTLDDRKFVHLSWELREIFQA